MSSHPSPINELKLLVTQGSTTYEQVIPDSASGNNSIQITNADILNAFNSQPMGTIFNPSIVATYAPGTFATGDVLSTPSVVESFIPRVISLADIPNKLTTDASFNLFSLSLIDTVSDGVLSYSSSVTSVATVNSSGQVTPVGAGTTTITVTQAATANYQAGTASRTFIVSLPPPPISLASNNVTIQYTGAADDVPTSSPRFIEANPRGTGDEWFAVVKDGMKDAITKYANGNNALNFDGINDAVDLGIPGWSYSTQFRSTMTIECWFKTTDDTNNQKLGEFVTKWNTGGYASSSMFLVGMIPTGEITCWITNASGTFASINTTTTYKDTQWHHVAVTYNSSTGVASMYIDGVFTNDSTNSASPTTSSFGLLSNNTSTRVIFGSDDAGTSPNTANDRQFRGSIAEVRVWNVVRTPTEILNNYKIQLNGNEPGLVSYNKLDQGVANGNNSGITTATNNMLSGGNTGTLLNFALSGTTSNWVSGPPLLSNSLFIPTGQTSPVPFNNIVTTLMTDMSLMFRYATTFNYNISSWNTSNVTNMSNMFERAEAFNQLLNYWDVSSVTNMFSMFTGAASFNQPLNNWDVSAVLNMTYMFGKASSNSPDMNFNQNISGWEVDQVITFNGFRSAAFQLANINMPQRFLDNGQ